VARDKVGLVAFKEDSDRMLQVTANFGQFVGPRMVQFKLTDEDIKHILTEWGMHRESDTNL